MTCWLQVILIFIFHYLSYCSDALADFGRVGNPLLVSAAPAKEVPARRKVRISDHLTHCGSHGTCLCTSQQASTPIKAFTVSGWEAPGNCSGGLGAVTLPLSRQGLLRQHMGSRGGALAQHFAVELLGLEAYPSRLLTALTASSASGWPKPSEKYTAISPTLQMSQLVPQQWKNSIGGRMLLAFLTAPRSGSAQPPWAPRKLNKDKGSALKAARAAALTFPGEFFFHFGDQMWCFLLSQMRLSSCHSYSYESTLAKRLTQVTTLHN